jgi:hypothetical protein
MSDRIPTMTPRIREALDELRGIIADRYPEATFEVRRGEEPAALWLVATVAVEDRYEVIDLFLDRLVELRVEEALPVFVDVQRTPEREAAVLAAAQQPAVVASLAP